MNGKIRGIYRIYHIETGKSYIGSSVDIKSRISGHFSRLSRGRSHTPKLQNAFNKYGPAAFAHEVLQQCSDVDLAEPEREWIIRFDSVDNGYNHSYDTTCATRGIKHSDESRQRMSAAQRIATSTPQRREISRLTLIRINNGKKGVPKSAEHRQKISESQRGKILSEEVKQNMRGKVRSEEARQNMRESHRFNPRKSVFGRTASEETRRKQSEAHKGKTGILSARSRAILQYGLDGRLLAEFVNTSLAAAELNLSRTGIKNCLNGYAKTHRGFIFKFK